jgi:hypothetical protein
MFAWVSNYFNVKFSEPSKKLIPETGLTYAAPLLLPESWCFNHINSY